MLVGSRLLAVLYFAAAAYAEGFHVDVKRVESLRSKLVREGNWALYQSLKSAFHSSRPAASSQPQPVIDYDDSEYIANISIGTPPQKFLVLLNMKSSAFWVPDKSCPGRKCPYYCSDVVTCKAMCDPRCCKTRSVARVSPSRLGWLGDCGWRNRFDSSKSSTYGKNGTLLYVPDAEGFVGIDTVTLGVDGLTIPSQTFGQATTASLGADDAYDGFLGINSDVFGVPGIVPVLANAKAQGVIERNLVTITLIREGLWSPDLPGGSITYGAVDTKNCDAVEAYVPAFYKDPAVLALDGITLGNVNARPDSNVAWIAAFESTHVRT